jgi:uracil phosphoribosyltransferase
MINQDIRILGAENSLLNSFLAQIRDVNIQQDRMRFRRNLERIGEIMAYEISKTFMFKESEIKTPLGKVKMQILQNQPVIATILRAGLPFHQGFLNYFDQAENAFIAAYRKHTTEYHFSIQIDYLSCPNLANKTIILADPMLATGWSAVEVYHRLLKKGIPSHLHIASVISAKPGIDFIIKNLPMDKVTLWTGAMDPELDIKSYIVPGLGDAGDLAFGEKI